MLRLTIVLAAATVGCATAPTPLPPPTSAQAKPATSSDDIAVLNERVSRLERRLAETDEKLALLLARSTPRATRDNNNLGPRSVEETPPPPKEEASLGARSIDLSTHRSSYEDPPEPVIKPEPDDGPPIVIKVVGDAPRDTAVSTPKAASIKREEPTSLEEPTGLSVKDQYDWAQARLKEGKYDDAVHVFEEIASRHAKHDLADNSVYWIAWCHQQQGDHKGAIEVWEKLPMRYPRSPKIPDALFGMAVSEEAIGEPAVAETLYEQLVSQYPRAEKVREAKAALSRLRPR